MKKKHLTQSGFLTVGILIALLLCVTAAGSMVSGTMLAFLRPEAPAKTRLQPCSTADMASKRTLTFQERVAYQRAIEEVYWRHRIWPKDNPQPKPPIDAIVSQAALENKVEDYLCKSQLVADPRGSPITSSELQAEMDRMAQHTKQPEVLRELFEALGNDPFVIAECLARPVLAERTMATVASAKESWVAKPTAQVPMTMAAVSANYTLPAIANPSGGCLDDTWTATSTINAPSGRWYHTAVWTGSEMIVWGGGISQDPFVTNTGGRYNPSTDSWIATSTTNAPSARASQVAVWTGSEMIVWGSGDAQVAVNTGGRYNPITDSWIPTSTATAPPARFSPRGVWTGSEMIVWGGSPPRNTGGRYTPGTDTWTPTSTTNAPSARADHTVVWTGNEMIVWGGTDFLNFFNTGGRYNPSTDSWVATNTANAPTGRRGPTAVWTGSEMIVWGGEGGGGYFNTGSRYSPNTDSWVATSITDAPSPRWFHKAVWTGSEMIVWAGRDAADYYSSGGRYNASTDSWRATGTTGAPSARGQHTAVWTGSEMIVWGGFDRLNYLNTGGRYCAASGATPTPTSTPTATPTTTATPTPTGTLTPTATPTTTPSVTPRATPTPRVQPTPRSHPSPAPRP